MRADTLDDAFAGDGHAVVVQDGHEPIGGVGRFQCQQGSHLRIAILFHHVDHFVLVDELPDRFTERKGFYPAIIQPDVFKDERGFFFENYNYKKYADGGISVKFLQDNHSRSVKNTLRGLHYQINPGQDKLVRVIVGEVFDVAVDIRYGSPTYGEWVGIYLSAENKKQVFIPKGFAHGFCVTSQIAEFEYKCSEYYTP